jgi:membrane fusion protein
LQQRQQRLDDIGRRSQLQRADQRSRLTALTDSLAQRRRMHALNEDDIAQARQQVAQARQTLGRLQSVAQYVELDRIERAQAELASRQDTLSRRLARRAELATELGNTESGMREARIELAKLDVQEAHERQQARETFEKDRSTQVVSSPTRGKVAFSHVTPGQYLREDDIAMAISGDGQRVLQAVLRIPSRQRGFVREGQEARLKFDAFPYARFGTYPVRLESISANTVATPRPSQLDPRGVDSDYLAYATLAQPFFTASGQQHQILPGMRATAAVVVERRRIAEWLLQPLFEAIRG